MADDKLAVFQDRIRKGWYKNEWWFSVVDIVGVLTDAPVPRNYWADMKRRIADEGFVEVLAKCQQLKMLSPDGKMRTTDAGTTETVLRIIQSIPSPRAEPFKQWLAKVGTERLQEDAQPSLGLERLVGRYRKKGYGDDWINDRLGGEEDRKDVTDDWVSRGAPAPRQIAVLTDTLSVVALDVTTKQHKAIKGLGPRDNLRDSETRLELLVTSVGEATASALHRKRDTQGFANLKSDCIEAGQVAKNTRLDIERVTGEPVVSPVNYKQLQQERQRELQPGLFDETEE